MNNPTKVAAFAVGLLAVFGAATAVGSLADTAGAGSTRAAEPEMADHTPTAAAEAHLPGGLLVSQDGYTLTLADRQLPRSEAAPLRFQILGPDGGAVTSYTREHGKDLHLIVVRRDLTKFQHVHPRLSGDGTWSVPLDLSQAGVYRVFADFTPAGHDEGLTLGADLSVPGPFEPEPLPATTLTGEVEDYTVQLDGELLPGQESKLTLTVSRQGQPVTDLQPYLEAYGHLVALRDGDLAYLHVHPAGSPGDGTTEPGPAVVFYATAPSAGAYRLFLDFQHGDRVRTAEFTVTAGRSTDGQRTTQAPTKPGGSSQAPTKPGGSSQAPSAHEEDDGHGHGG
jgi:hypothetical protein